MKRMDMQEQSSYDYMLTAEYASLVALEFNRNPVINDEAAFDIYPPPTAADRDSLPPRPPVVTIMGHVDHGKTTLLDTLRSSSVAKGEAGGITQHIGAFSVPVPNPGGEKRTITFLDTPGHAAFSAMRARGASVTDIVVLVVAADDGIMPQTKEVLELVKKDSNKVGLVVAINKVDKPGVDVSKIETALLAEGVQLETFGGDVPVVHVSGLTGQGLPTLVETISLVAEMQDLRAEQKGPIHGYVLESRVDKGLGPTATVLILRGQLTPGMGLISGLAHGKVRLLKSPAGESLKAVGPGTAALVSGWKELPKAGDEVLTGTDGEIKKALANRARKADLEATIQDAEAINESRRAERELVQSEAAGAPAAPTRATGTEKKELRLIVKGDVSGTVEAVCGAVVGIGNHIAGVKVVAQGVGEVSESDVMRAKAVEGMIVAFSVNIPRPVKAMAASQGVKILESNIIYALMDEVKKNVIDLLPTTTEKRVTGEANVLQIFEIQLKAKQTMKVAGCRVINGVVEKNKKARVVRNGATVFEGSLETLKHLKRDIMEAGKGLECGMAFDGWDDLREGDLIQMYQEIVKPGQL
ncbi:translation initiation factor IF-2 [Phanerochaete sordida]|uniref:Translation initiation factor IF-2, mitochondrial n=1 Tax=Phanerochaete sordida TaxID=48140 RepID=A0A9P3GHM3_9APHY|nr:translation initiation factor IF-2 [Phanerochaete sordida]